MRATFKSLREGDTAEVTFGTLLQKGDLEEGILTCVVYPVELEDHQNDIADRDVVKDMCHNFIARGGMIDLEHDLEPMGANQVRLAENFIVHKGHPDFQGLKDDAGNPVDEEGAWAIKIKLLTDELLEAARSGDIGGVSMFGQAEFEEETVAASDVDDVVEAVVKRLSQSDDTEDDDMKPEELAKALEDNNTKLSESIVTGLAKALTKDGDSGDDGDTSTPKKKTAKKTVEFKGDRTKPMDVRKHKLAVTEANLDWNDDEAVEKYLEDLEEFNKLTAKAKKSKGDDDDDGENAAEIAKLKKQLAKLEGTSSQGGDDADDDDDSNDDDATTAKSGKRKRQMQLVKSGIAATKSLNAERGYTDTKTGS